MLVSMQEADRAALRKHVDRDYAVLPIPHPLATGEERRDNDASRRVMLAADSADLLAAFKAMGPRARDWITERVEFSAAYASLTRDVEGAYQRVKRLGEKREAQWLLQLKWDMDRGFELETLLREQKYMASTPLLKRIWAANIQELEKTLGPMAAFVQGDVFHERYSGIPDWLIDLYIVY